MSTQNNRDNEDRKSVRRENFSKKKTRLTRFEDSDEFRAKNKISKEFKSKKRDMSQEELWEDWEEQLDRYNK
jgi:hypothetical protein